jgi:predicted dithiol-disulfide oxidoreductase (DUF899 family)
VHTPPIVSPQEWEAARQELLVQEKEVTRARDALAAQRRRMPTIRWCERHGASRLGRARGGAGRSLTWEG